MKRALSIIAAIACLHPTSNLLAGDGHANDGYNVVWTSPSKDYNGSMPIGNGELAANVWGEPRGDLIFYLSKSDTWTGEVTSHGPELVKLGRFRVRLDHAAAV